MGTNPTICPIMHCTQTDAEKNRHGSRMKWAKFLICTWLVSLVFLYFLVWTVWDQVIVLNVPCKPLVFFSGQKSWRTGFVIDLESKRSHSNGNRLRLTLRSDASSRHALSLSCPCGRPLPHFTSFCFHGFSACVNLARVMVVEEGEEESGWSFSALEQSRSSNGTETVVRHIQVPARRVVSQAKKKEWRISGGM